MARSMFRLPAVKLGFVEYHYAYILSCCVLAFIVLYPGASDLRAIDAVFFGASANTESGLNTIDVKALHVYQQLALYFFPIITNIGVIHPVVIFIRLRYFEKRFKEIGRSRSRRNAPTDDEGRIALETLERNAQRQAQSTTRDVQNEEDQRHSPTEVESSIQDPGQARDVKLGQQTALGKPTGFPGTRAITFEERPVRDDEGDRLAIERLPPLSSQTTAGRNSLFRNSGSYSREDRTQAALQNLPRLSAQVSVGRNSLFYNLTKEDREVLGGIEYRSLRILLVIVIAYYIGMHIFGIISLLPWILHAPAKYTDYLASQGQSRVWWAFYSTQTMINNLGFTLTPDSMVSFRDATWPMLVMTFLALAGETCYPVFLRVLIWILWKMAPRKRSFSEPLRFLLDHPRRCYTLLFPGNVTRALFGVIFALNFIDVLFIVTLDLHSEEVGSMPFGPRLLAAIFQAVSSRHTGTATFNLAKVNPAVQFSLVVMMYVAVFPIAMSVRSSNTYESRSIGIRAKDTEADEATGTSTYLASHLRNQLSHDLWYIACGCFVICIIEAKPLGDPTNTAFTVFAILFEVVSAYGNVGLSLGTNATLTSLCGDFHTGSKLVICAMMIRGRHRALPEAVDRAVMLPGEDVFDQEEEDESGKLDVVPDRPLRRIKTM